jgi:hypothetical protein
MTNQNIKICKIHIPDSFYPDRTGRGGFYNIKVDADILYKDKLITVSLVEALDLHCRREFDIWGQNRNTGFQTEITDKQEQEAINNFRIYLHKIYDLENVQRYLERLVNACEYYIEHSEYNKEYVVKSKAEIENEISRLQEQLSYFNQMKLDFHSDWHVRNTWHNKGDWDITGIYMGLSFRVNLTNCDPIYKERYDNIFESVAYSIKQQIDTLHAKNLTHGEIYTDSAATVYEYDEILFTDYSDAQSYCSEYFPYSDESRIQETYIGIEGEWGHF